MFDAMKNKISQAYNWVSKQVVALYNWVRKQVVAVYNKIMGFFRSIFNWFKNLSLFKSKDAADCCADKTKGAANDAVAAPDAGNAAPTAVVKPENGENAPAGAAPTDPQTTTTGDKPAALTEANVAALDAANGDQAAPKKDSSRASSKAGK